MFGAQKPTRPSSRRRRRCHTGHHVAGADIIVDSCGVEHGRCRYCGCELRRMPTIGRWFASVLMGGDPKMTKV